MTITVGTKEVLYSGCVTSINNGDVLFDIAENIKVCLKFLHEDGDASAIRSTIEDGILQITLVNFNNPLGTEFSEAFKIGTYQGRSLFLHVRVYAMSGTNNRVITHTWYLDNVVSNG